MANSPPSFSSFPDLPSFSPPPPPEPKPSSSRYSSSRRSRSPESSRKGKLREDDRTRRRGEPVDDRRSRSNHSRREDRDGKHRSRRKDEGREKRRERDRDRGEGPSLHHHHPSKRRSRSRSRSPSSHHSKVEPSRSERPQDVDKTEPERLEVNDQFYTSGKGDESNVFYGSLHKYSLAKYRRSGAGSVIGLPRRFKIAREPPSSTGPAALVLEWDERRTGGKTLRYSEKSARSMLNSASLVLRPSSTTSQSTLGDYTPFSKRRRTEPPIEAPYRTHEKESEASADEDDGGIADLIGEDEDTSDIETKDSTYRSKNVQFSQRAEEAPLDAQNWIEWARFSAQAGFNDRRPLAHLPSSASHEGAGGGPSASSRAAITFTILDRAALSYPKLKHDLTFVLALLKAAEEVESPLELGRRWKSVLEGPLNKDVSVWRAWGNWKMARREGQEGEVGTDVATWAQEGLQMIRALWKHAPSGSLESEDLEGVQIYLLLRACLALREAGYIERAVAVFQAQMELAFFLPTSVSRWPWFEQLSSLETFWESEALRFGESGSKGWSNSLDAPAPPPAMSSPPPTPVRSADDPFAVDDPFARWLEVEMVADETVLPSRTEDDPRQVGEDLTDEDDPFRLVMWPDIAPFLLPLQSASSKMQLIYALFSFLDLPFVPPDVSTSTAFFSDSFLLNSLAHSAPGRAAFFPDHLRTGASERRRVGEGGMEPELEGGIPTPYGCGVKASPVTVEALIPASSDGPGVLERHSVDAKLRPLISNVLEQLRVLHPQDTTYALYVLSFEASQNVKSAIQRAKSILADNRDSLVLWNAYARLERQRGKVAEARKVYLRALSLSSSEVQRASAAADGETWALFKGWAEMEWSEGRDAHAVAEIAAAASGDFSNLDSLVMLEPPTVSSVQALQTRHFLAQAIKTTFDPSSPPSTTRNSTNLVFLSGLFEYLVGGLQSACDSYDRHLAFDTMSAAEKEELYLQYADLLYRHASSPHSTFQPVQIRTVLEQAIKAFPSNTTLLAYYAATESRMRYQNRVRKVLDDVVLSPTAGAKGPNGFLFAIWAELRAVKGRHNEWAVRSLFERAFDRPDANQSLSLWRLAIEHEMYLGKPKRAKALLYQAIRACPWAKDLYLLPFGSLRSAYTAKELEELANLMAQRRIRVRIALDAFVEDWQEEAGDDDGGDAMREEGIVGVDELRLIREQEERKRLMPY